jgi:cysteine-rich repeat protein
MLARALPFVLLLVVAGCSPGPVRLEDAGAAGGSTSFGGGSANVGGGAAGGSALEACGDGRREPTESCDDGNQVTGDGCSARCGVEAGWFCPFPAAGMPSRCMPSCGDSRLVDMEPCDDGNRSSQDGCSASCSIEPGFTCAGQPSVCTTTCGDGLRGGRETCDDLNTRPLDGCSATCTVEPGFTCTGTPSQCLPDPVVDAGTPVDAGSGVDSGTPIDAGALVDAGTPMDAGLPTDAGLVDAGTPVDAGAPDAGPPGMGALVFQPIANVTFTDDLKRVVWHPSGRFALLVGATNRVIRYDAAARTLTLVQQLGTSLTDLDVASDGSFFLVVGQSSPTASRLWRIDVGLNDALAMANDLGAIPGTVADVEVEPGSTRFAIVARQATFGVNSLFTWTPMGGLSTPRGYNASGHAFSLMWGARSLYANSPNVLTADGVNGADSRTWVETSGMVVANGWPGGFGNPGQGAWQPGGGWGAFVGWSSNKLYVFDGSWHLVTLPGPTGISPQALAFRADGQRALVVGRAVGTPLRATVIEYRPTGPGAYGDLSWVDASIAGFGAPPFSGNSNQHLLDVAWRPGACDEGLIVGADNGSSLSPTFGLAVRFYDSSQPVCSP